MKFLKSFLWLIVICIFNSCDQFEEINVDPARSSETLPEYLLGNAEKSALDIIYNNYYNGRQGMQLSQYWMGTDKTSDGRFLFTDDGLWSRLYSGPLADLQEIENYYDRHPDEVSPHTLAAAEIFKSWIFHILTDVYVDVPYSQALQGGTITQPVFDSGEDIYIDILANLANQIEVLKKPSTVIRGDIISNGDVDQWIRFANALRLRMAMRMIDVKEGEAKAIIAEAATQTLSSVDQDVYFPYSASAVSSRFPYNNVERPLVEFAVTTTLIDFLKELNDPRLTIYARPDETNGKYIGKEYGQELNDPTVIGLSKPGAEAYSGSAKGYVITYSEVAFILAEAAARGVSVGKSAAEWYEEGIRAAMKQWNVTDDSVIDDYILSVPYDGGPWRDVIGSQKWLALYLQGIQGWMERLRLDFKKPNGEDLFIAPVSGSLDPEVDYLPSRLTYPTSTKANNIANSTAASSRIGGDSQATKNWWDIN